MKIILTILKIVWVIFVVATHSNFACAIVWITYWLCTINYYYHVFKTMKEIILRKPVGILVIGIGLLIRIILKYILNVIFLTVCTRFHASEFNQMVTLSDRGKSEQNLLLATLNRFFIANFFIRIPSWTIVLVLTCAVFNSENYYHFCEKWCGKARLHVIFYSINCHFFSTSSIKHIIHWKTLI